MFNFCAFVFVYACFSLDLRSAFFSVFYSLLFMQLRQVTAYAEIIFFLVSLTEDVQYTKLADCLNRLRRPGNPHPPTVVFNYKLLVQVSHLMNQQKQSLLYIVPFTFIFVCFVLLLLYFITY